MERRVFVAILLSFAVLYGYQALFVPPQKPAVNVVEPKERPAQTAPQATPQVVEQPPAEAEPAAKVSDSAERLIVVETSTSEVVLTNRGGRVLHWRLKDYRDAQGNPVDLVPSSVPEDQPKPFTLVVDDAALTRRLNNALYRVSGDAGGRVDASKQPGTLSFEFADAAGVRVRKDFRFDPKNYVVAFSTDVVNGDRALNPTIAWGPGLGDAGATAGGGSFFTGNYVQPPQAIYEQGGDVERIKAAKVVEQPAHEGNFRFAGIDDHYFLAAAVNPGNARLEYKPLTLSGPDKTERQFLAQSIRFPQSPKDVRFFVGPKQFDVLRSVDQQLVWAISFGTFRFLAVPLLTSLKWVYGFLGNYGWSIILLTIIINLVIFPLRHKSLVSMRKMQALQPQLKSIQDRYSGLKMTDPGRQKMQSEIMGLYMV